MAEHDLIDRANYYMARSGSDLGERFVTSALDSLRSTERMPQAGAGQIGELCNVPELRTWPVVGFPCSWFYFIHPEHLDIVRLLSHSQDLPAMLG